MTKVEVDLAKLKDYLAKYNCNLEIRSEIIKHMRDDMARMAMLEQQSLELLIKFFEDLGISCQDEQL
jgi:hypothetical protein